MLEINNRNYDIQIALFCGTDKTDVSGEKSNKNASYLLNTSVTELSIKTSILKPCFEGYFDYDDSNAYSYVRQLVVSPFVYGHLTFAMVDPNVPKGSAESSSYVKGETFDEKIVITGIDSVPYNGAEKKSSFRFKFASLDSVNFSATLKPYSTMDKTDGLGELKDILNAVFANAGLDGKFDFSKNVPNLKIPFVTTYNMSLNDALDYIYRKSFDCNILTDNSTYGFFKVVYDHIKQKYVIWRFDSLGKDPTEDTPSPSPSNFAYINEKRVVNCDLTNSNPLANSGGGKSMARVMFSGNVFDMMTSFADRKHYGYDYVKNDFENNVEEVKDFWKNNIHDSFMPDKFKVKTSLFEKSKYDKTLKFDVSHSSYRENASVYDMYNEMIFGSAYIHVESTGIIGRKASDPVLIKFIDEPTSPYNKLRGDYLITSHSNTYVKNNSDYGGAATLRSEMECYTPYVQTESNSETTSFVWK